MILTSMKTPKAKKIKNKNQFFSSITQNLRKKNKTNLNSSTIKGQKRERTVHFKKKALRSTKHSMKDLQSREGLCTAPKQVYRSREGQAPKTPRTHVTADRPSRSSEAEVPADLDQVPDIGNSSKFHQVPP